MTSELVLEGVSVELPPGSEKFGREAAFHKGEWLWEREFGDLFEWRVIPAREKFKLAAAMALLWEWEPEPHTLLECMNHKRAWIEVARKVRLG